MNTPTTAQKPGRDSIIASSQYNSLVIDYFWCRHNRVSIQDSIKFLVKWNILYVLMKLPETKNLDLFEPKTINVTYMGKNQTFPHVNMGLIPQPSYYKIEKVWKDTHAQLIDNGHVYQPFDVAMDPSAIGHMTLDKRIADIGNEIYDMRNRNQASVDDCIFGIIDDLHTNHGVSFSIEHAERLAGILMKLWRNDAPSTKLVTDLRQSKFLRNQKPLEEGVDLIGYYRPHVLKVFKLVPREMITVRNVITTINNCKDHPEGVPSISRAQISATAKALHAELTGGV
jgi:microcompartment protein CcmK/EutM